jgi:cytochrome c peroxidase
MGPALAESFHAARDIQNSVFITAKLWGVADTAPYLHDGRAQTLRQAIVLHGGEAEDAREAFVGLAREQQGEILSFLRTLRTPRHPNRDVVQQATQRHAGPFLNRRRAPAGPRKKRVGIPGRHEDRG